MSTLARDNSWMSKTRVKHGLSAVAKFSMVDLVMTTPAHERLTMIQSPHCVSQSYAFNRLARSLGAVAALSIGGFAYGLPAHADVLTDNSERQIRAIAAASTGKANSAVTSNNVTYRPLGTATGTQATVSSATTSYAAPANTRSTADLSSSVSSYVFGDQPITGDSMQGLIQQKQQQYQQLQNAQLSIEERSRIKAAGSSGAITRFSDDEDYSIASDSNGMDFDRWLNTNPYRAQKVAEYRRYLGLRVGAANVPPMDQLLTTARSWATCGYEPYQLPPEYLWQNMVPTLKLYATLKQQGLLPASTEIRSVYRSPGLNQCAGGANASKHMSAGAIDIWIPEYQNTPWRRSSVQDGLCDFWLYQGVAYDFGLGLYSTGAIHLDTQGYRKWGSNHSSSSSPCRYD